MLSAFNNTHDGNDVCSAHHHHHHPPPSFPTALWRAATANNPGGAPPHPLFPYAWPLSYQSAPQWVAVFSAVMSVWVASFILRCTPAVASRAAAARLAKNRALQAAALTWHRAEVAKGKDGLPEAARLFALLYDEEREAPTADDGDLPLARAVEGLLRRAAAKELRKAVRLTRQARFPDDGDGGGDGGGGNSDGDGGDGDGDGGDGDGDGAATSTADLSKALAEHASGEKLHDAVERTDKWQEQLGGKMPSAQSSSGGGANAPAPAHPLASVRQLARAKSLLRRVYRAQSTNRRELYRLIRPALPHMLVGGAAAVVNCCLRGVFHSIGGWTRCLELALEGDRAASVQAIFVLWLGHLAIECIERIDSSYVFRAQALFTARIREGVLTAMLTQDYEFFDRHAPGVLQDRLDRDSAELGENLVRFPQRLLHRVAWIGVNVLFVVQTAPSTLLLPALAPLLVTLPLQYYCFKANRRSEARQSKAQERAVATTSEILREIKTVRQFAMEPAECCRFAESEGLLAHAAEAMQGQRQLTDWLFWSAFCTGLFATMCAGLGYVERREMKVSALLDIVFRINCHISFPLRDMIDELPLFARLLRPLGRICDLLQANPRIEPGAAPSFVVAASAPELAAVLACCDTTATVGDATSVGGAAGSATCTGGSSSGGGGGGGAFTALRRALPPSLRTSAVAPAQGAHVTALLAADSHYVRVHGDSSAVLDKALSAAAAAAAAAKAAAAAAAAAEGGSGGSAAPPLAFPVRVIFSRGLRPARFRGKIEFRDVTWAPPTDSRRTVLTGASFVVHPGEKVALVGPTGCGKSSCMGLLQRLYEPDGGVILLDDVPIGDYDVHFLRSRVVIVDQSTVLFNASIRDNVAYGLPRAPSDAEVVQACKDAKAWEFIAEKPDGLMTMVMDGGKNLSGGQRQRLAIARAMIRRPDVILLDEATSALDNENEALVQEALDAFARRGSALVIAHRLSTIKDADRICVIDRGRVVEAGSHDALLAKAKAEAEAADAEAERNAAATGGCTATVAAVPGAHAAGGDAVTVGAALALAAPAAAAVAAVAAAVAEELILGAPPPSPPSLQQCVSDDSSGSSPRKSPRSVQRSPGGALDMGMPPMRRARTEGTKPVAAAPKAVASYARLWNAATGEQGKKSLDEIRAKMADLQHEMAQLRRRAQGMLRIKNALLSPAQQQQQQQQQQLLQPTLARQISVTC